MATQCWRASELRTYFYGVRLMAIGDAAEGGGGVDSKLQIMFHEAPLNNSSA